MSTETVPELGTDNPFAAPSGLPYGLPPFDLVRPEHFAPAFEAGMARHRREVDAIAGDPAEATFANTVEALERSGALLTRVSQVFWNLTGSVGTDELTAIELDVAPRLASHADAVRLDPKLFARLRSLLDRAGALGLDEEQRRLVERHHRDAVRAGAALDPADQERIRAINAELSTLASTFRARLLADTNDLALHLAEESELEGLPADAVGTARAAAADRGLEGYLLTLVLPTGQPALASLRRRDVRERLHRASVARGRRGNEHDTRETLTRIAELRAQHARLLGYDDHAAYAVADQTARTSAAVAEMLGALVAPAVENAHAEAAELEALLVADGEAAPLQPWDWAYYAERVRRQRFDVDADAVRPWFELERVSSTASSTRRRALRPAVQAPARPARLPPRRAGLRGARRRGSRDRAVPRRLVRPPEQARGRLDEQLRRPVPPARLAPRGRRQPQHRRARPTGTPRC